MQIKDFFPKSSSVPAILSDCLPTLRTSIVDAGFGNIGSVLNALELLGVQPKLSRDAFVLRESDAIILPGVGSFTDGMRQLHALGLPPILNELAVEQKRPFLGICLGMQLMAQAGTEGASESAKSSENLPETPGLGWIDGRVIHFNEALKNNSGLKIPLKIPHVGWNDVQAQLEDSLLGAVGSVQSYYFVHSYYLQTQTAGQVVGLCDYGINFPAVVRRNNVWGVQFHPEKSHKAGLHLLANFLVYAAGQREGRPC